MPKANIVKLNRTAFKAALRQIVVDEEFRKRLEIHPVKTLESMGLTLPTKAVKQIGDRRLSQVISEIDLGPGAKANVLVDVGVDVAVDVVVEVAVKVATKSGAGLGVKESVINKATKQAQAAVAAANTAARM